MSDMRPARCQAFREDGEPCEAAVLGERDERFCWSHSAATEDVRTRARHIGGIRGGLAAKRRWLRTTAGHVESPAEVRDTLAAVIEGLWQLPPSSSNANAIVRAAELGLKAFEAFELADAVMGLEKVLQAVQPGGLIPFGSDLEGSIERLRKLVERQAKAREGESV